ncbi:hypothetical protein RHGRI_011276 [Rhododendron griersonianum]|uniref:Lactate/malate dehydrogenase C-terminal domain-containing protein n=1 Tax=Rhododendron griersonianum TaxID=479676 RepID=A0AAV6KM62_9ERIC|nr:hypothetical protein RHGRI_011276 [Rhododendron griersonianum]
MVQIPSGSSISLWFWVRACETASGLCPRAATVAAGGGGCFVAGWMDDCGVWSGYVVAVSGCSFRLAWVDCGGSGWKAHLRRVLEMMAADWGLVGGGIKAGVAAAVADEAHEFSRTATGACSPGSGGGIGALFLLLTTDVEGQFEIAKAIFKYQTLIDEYQISHKLAPKAGVFYDKVSNVTIWGNHSTTQVPDFLNARINSLPVIEVINNVNWSEEEFTKKVQKRGEVLIQKWGRSSGASTAFSIVDAIRSLVTPTPKAIGFLLDFDINVFVFARGVDADTVVLMATRASRVENKDAIDTATVGTLADPKEARAGIQEVHFLPFSPTDKRTALAYIDSEGKMHQVSKGAPKQILNIAHNESEIERRVHAVIDKFAQTFFVYARISQLKLNVHTISADNSTETTYRSEALLALPSNTPNKKSKKGDHNSSTSTSGPAIDTPANSSLTTNSPTTEETQDSHSKNK